MNQMSCFGREATDSTIMITDCESISRILSAMKYVASIRENIGDESTQNIALEVYFNEEYLQCLNDYTHIISVHSKQLEVINEQLNQCPLSKCKMAHRCNHNDRRYFHNDAGIMHENASINFYKDLIDRIHFWLYHQFDVGIRVKRSIMDEEDGKEVDFIENEYDGYYDGTFAKMRREVVKRRNKWKMNHTNAQSVDQCKKYTMFVENGQFMNKYLNEEMTYIDSLFEELKKRRITMQTIEVFSNLLVNEDYDTDAFMADIIDYEQGSNIITITYQQQFMDVIKEISDDLREDLDGLLSLS